MVYRRTSTQEASSFCLICPHFIWVSLFYLKSIDDIIVLLLVFLLYLTFPVVILRDPKIHRKYTKQLTFKIVFFRGNCLVYRKKFSVFFNRAQNTRNQYSESATSGTGLSPLLRFRFWEPVYYLIDETEKSFPGTEEKRGQYVGIYENIRIFYVSSRNVRNFQKKCPGS